MSGKVAPLLFYPHRGGQRAGVGLLNVLADDHHVLFLVIV